MDGVAPVTTACFIGNMAHPFCSEVHWVRALEENGVTVTPLQADDVVRHPEEAMAIAKRSDACFYTRTHSPGRFLDHSWTARWRELEDAGVRTLGIHLDRYFDLEREHLVTHEPRDAQFTMGLVATADGGSQERFEATGVNHVWFKPGVDRQEACTSPDRLLSELVGKIIFTGSAGQYHPEYAQRGQLLRFLHDTYGSQFVHIGHGGDRPVVRQTELNAALTAAAIVVGDSCFANSPGWRTDTRKYTSDRLFESIGRGAFVLFPRLPFMEADFGIEPGEHCAVYEPGDWQYLAAQISYYLTVPEERRRIAQTGREHVLAEHTYTRRIAELLATVGLAEVSPGISGARVE